MSAEMSTAMKNPMKKSLLCSEPDSYLDRFTIDEMEKEFRVVWVKDLKADAALGVGIEVAVIRPWFPAEINLVQDNIHLLPNFKLAYFQSAGMDRTNIDFFKPNGIKVAYAPYVQDDACADLTLGLMIAAARNIIEGVKIAMSPSMPSFNLNYLGTEVTGATVGIVGMGGIGYKVAKRARGFEMKILYHNRRQRSSEVEGSVGATYCPTLHGLLNQSDFVVITCPHTPETEGLIGDAEFDAMKPTAILINIARGKIINHDALVRALRVNKIHKAALDVTDPEPLPRDHPLLSLPNVIITPHIASYTDDTRKKMTRRMLDNIRAFLEGRPLMDEYTG